MSRSDLLVLLLSLLLVVLSNNSADQVTSIGYQNEVSIGNYGNKLDADVAPSSSTTTPAHALFDGHAYRYLPWDMNKPVTTVESHWEDVSFRLETLNILLKVPPPAPIFI